MAFILIVSFAPNEFQLQIKILEMHEDDTLIQLRILLDKLKFVGLGKARIPIEGQIIEILKKLSYFRGEAETYGIQVLSYFIPLIEPYMLRAGMQIIDNQEEYVVLDGTVRGMKSNGQPGNVYRRGALIDPPLELFKQESQRESLCSTPQADAKLIKIFINSKDLKYLKHSQSLAKFQKQQIAKQREMQRLLLSDKGLQANKDKIIKFQFFSNICSFDLLEMLVESKLVLYKRGAIIHEFGEQADRIFFLVSGQVKIDNSVIHDRNKPLQAGKLILDKYMVHKKQKSSSVVTIIEPSEWIGLEEYLWSEFSYVSRSQVISHDAEIFILPSALFERKFNELTNYFEMNKLKGLIQTKKKLLSKAIKSKKEKEQQIIDERERSQAIQRLQMNMMMEKNLKKEHVLQTNKSCNSNSKKKQMSPVCLPSQCYMPERLVHKLKVFQQKYETLPKIQERFMLFPEEYEKAMIPLELRDELRMMKKARDPSLQISRPYKMLKQSKIYEKVIYATLSPKNKQNPELHTSRRNTIAKIKSKASLQASMNDEKFKEFYDTIGASPLTTRPRFNSSICNNFRAPKNKGQRLLQNIAKTLQIIQPTG